MVGIIKSITVVIDNTFKGIFGLTIIDLIPSIDMFDSVPDWIRMGFIISGFIYYIINIVHKIKMNKYAQKNAEVDIKIKEKKLENE